MSLKISIVIPTRNRAEYLKYAIETCLRADDPNFELIVSDNNSEDNTREVVESFDSPYIRYVHTGESVSMRRNYEFALGHVTGDYILYIGDDDGVFKNGLATLRLLLEKQKPDVVNWRHITYIWPRKGDDERDGILKFRYRDFFGPLVEKSPQLLLSEFCVAERTNYRDGANIYHGCVSRRLVDGLKEKTGEYFCGQSPDLYASLANLTAAKSFLWIRNPVTIAGEGAKSSGAAFGTKQQQTTVQKKIAADFVTLVERDTVPPETDLRIRSVVAVTYALLDRVNKSLENRKLEIDHCRWRERSREDIANISPELRAVNENILEELFARIDPTYTPRLIVPSVAVQTGGTPLRKKIGRKHGDLSETHLQTTMSVALWVDRITGCPYDPVRMSILKKVIKMAGMLMRGKSEWLRTRLAF